MQNADRAHQVKKATFLIAIFAVLLCGCSDEIFSPRGKEGEEEPGIIDYMIGSEQIDAYKKTKSKVEGINKGLKERYKW